MNFHPSDLSAEHHDRFIELLALPLAEFAEVTKGINPKPCVPEFEPEAFLLRESRFASVPVNQLRSELKTEFRGGGQIFRGWVLLAAEQAKSEIQGREAL